MNSLACARRAGTFSICAVDPETGTAGVAVASRAIAVGALVPYAEPGAGAIATQAVLNPRYGVKGLEMLRKKLPATEVVRRLTQEDVTVAPDQPQLAEYYNSEHLTEEGVDFLRDRDGGLVIWFTRRIRQLGVVDHLGRAATYDGARIAPDVASIAGQGFSCQGNTLTGKDVVTAMAEAYTDSCARSRTMLASLLAALKAGDAAGGDKRGRKSAAVLVAREHGHWSGTDRFCDVRVDDDEDPVARLAVIAAQYEVG